MNFLAHCSLAHDAASLWGVNPAERQGLLAGAVVGDFIKGQIPQTWPDALRAGTALHRKIDALSNVSPGIRETCNRFPKHLRRFAPIFVDILADHTLALTWADYYHMPRNHFSRECYFAIGHFQSYLYPDAKRFFEYMSEVDLLANYDQWQHVNQGLKSVLRRLNKSQWHAEVEDICREILTESHGDFSRYYPHLRKNWRHWNAFNTI